MRGMSIADERSWQADRPGARLWLQWQWGGMSGTDWPHEAKLRDRLRRNLQRRPGCPVEPGELRLAAVAIVIVPSPGGACLLLTLRTSRLARHSGQYALPGGRLDPGEDTEAAARRELEEELGIVVASGSLLGCLDDLPTASGWRVTPHVFWHDSAEVAPDPGEVDRVFPIPLAELFASPPDAAPSRIAPEADAFWMYLPTLGHEVYAPTAAILRQFREVALMGRDARMLAFREPRFARQ